MAIVLLTNGNVTKGLWVLGLEFDWNYREEQEIKDMEQKGN